jgi:hypothetical protein
VGADQVRLKGPLERIRVEVAQEDMDEERAIESVLLDSDIGDPFTILAILGGRVAGRVLTGRIHCLFLTMMEGFSSTPSKPLATIDRCLIA